MLSVTTFRALRSSKMLQSAYAGQSPRLLARRTVHGAPSRNEWHHPQLLLRSCAASLSTLSREGEFLSLRINIRAQRQEEWSSNNARPRILATSSNVSSMHDQEGFLSRFVQWCKEWLESLWEAIQVSLRVTEISLRLSPLLILSPAALVAAQLSPRNDHNFVSDLAWNYLMHVVQALGPGYVKLCQWIATRRDIFPVVVCDRLSQLQDQGYPHSMSESHRMLQKAFGADYEEKGLQLEEVIGCGSAAQVYKGTLLVRDDSTGTQQKSPVAIKILHPWFKRQLENDLWLMDTVARWVHSLPSETIRMVNLPRAVDNFGGNLRKQSDLTLEADNLKQFRLNFYGEENDESTSSILFPQPRQGWISPQVLVEDLVENSTSIAEFLKDNTELGLQTRKELAGPLLSAFLKMVFQDNFVHADIHAGNCLVQTTTTTKRRSTMSSKLFQRFFNSTSSSTSQPENDNNASKTTKRTIVFLDAGIVTSLNENDRKNLRDLFRAVILNDGYEAGRLMVERARYERCSQTEGGVDAFASGVGDIVSEFHDRRKSGLTLGAVRIGSLLGRVLDLCRIHGVEIDPAMASIVVSTLVLEGLGRSLEPSLNLMDCAVPYVLGRGKV